MEENKPTRPTGKMPIEVAEYITHIEAELAFFKESPYLKPFIAVKTTVDNWCNQLTDTEINILDPESKDVFTMGHKFLTELKPYIELQAFLLEKMTPKDKEEANKIPSGAVAEKFIFGKNGKI